MPPGTNSNAGPFAVLTVTLSGAAEKTIRAWLSANTHGVGYLRKDRVADVAEFLDALRRVAGLSTELQDITEVEYRELRLERVVLMGVWTDGTLAAAENSLRELSRLAETAGSHVLDGLIQRRSRVDAATYIGSGKARELADIVASAGADTVICDG